jgi:hypothetical protein
MGTKTFNIGPLREQNGNQVVSFGFTYSELGRISEAISELISDYTFWLDDDRPDVVKDTQEIIDSLTQLEHKVELYRSKAYENKLEGEEE